MGGFCDWDHEVRDVTPSCDIIRVVYGSFDRTYGSFDRTYGSFDVHDVTP